LKFASADDPNARLKAPEYLLSSATAGVLAAIFTNPFWVVKTRMLTTAINKPGAYLSMTDGFRKILRTEGPRGLMRGFVPSMFLVGQGAITFVCYELLKNWRAGEKGKLGSIDYLALSAAAKTASGTLTYPYRVVQTRMQNFDVGYKGPIDVLRKIWRVEGFSGLYKGCVSPPSIT
jgi:solute carrier family 25 folate transporter 32